MIPKQEIDDVLKRKLLDWLINNVRLLKSINNIEYLIDNFP